MLDNLLLEGLAGDNDEPSRVGGGGELDARVAGFVREDGGVERFDGRGGVGTDKDFTGEGVDLEARVGRKS